MITVNGNVSSNFPNLKSPDVKDESTKKAEAAAPPQIAGHVADPVSGGEKTYKHGLIPNWPILQLSKIMWAITAANVSFQSQKIQGFSFNGQYDKGTVLTSAKAQSFFGGRLEIPRVRIILNQNPLVFDISSQLSQIELAAPIHASFPQTKAMFDGFEEALNRPTLTSQHHQISDSNKDKKKQQSVTPVYYRLF